MPRDARHKPAQGEAIEQGGSRDSRTPAAGTPDRPGLVEPQRPQAVGKTDALAQLAKTGLPSLASSSGWPN